MEELPGIKEVVDLRIELLYKKNKGKIPFLSEYYKSPTQGLPFKLHLRVTNISNMLFKGAHIKNSYFEAKSCGIVTASHKEIQLGTLNPKDSTIIEIDSFTLKIDGPTWFQMNISPLSTNQDILSYQYDDGHKTDDKYQINKFGTALFVEEKLASLQTKTNNYILALTLITVLEAVIGIKNTLQTIVIATAKILGGIASALLKISGSS